MNQNDPVMTAKELLEYRRSTGGLQEFPPPRVVIFAPQKSLASYVLRKYSARKVTGFLGEFYLLTKIKGEIALSTGFGISAPVIAGLPGVAVSLEIPDGHVGPIDFEPAALAAGMAVRNVLQSGLPADTLLNVNVPFLKQNEIQVFRMTRQVLRVYQSR